MEHSVSTARSDLEQMLVDGNAEPRALPLSLLKDITGDFSVDQQIGSGGFSVVYKGILGDRAVAVKRLSNAYMHEKQFHGEVECLMRVKHKNIVRFIGYCADTQGNMGMYGGKLVMADVVQRLLCFEYIPKGSLDKYILDAYRQWGTCYEIIKGICEGLRYLHEHNIIHLDLKPANILLGDNMIPKITDFGLSRCFDENQSRHITKNVVGTMGYLVPELRKGGVIARSADLYSLGVIIIEILTGHRGYAAIEDVLESWSDRLERSERHILCEQIQVCYEIALECRGFNPKNRPTSARDIIDRLHEMESIQELRKSVIGILEVGVLGARNLFGMKVKEGRLTTDSYCVAKYGEKWVRTPTVLDTLAPQWNEHYTWDVFDLSTVISVAVFDDCHLNGDDDAMDQRMGKVRIPLATLETDRVYTHYYPLMTAVAPTYIEKTGEIYLTVRFTCKSWARLLAMYTKPLPHTIHHTNPIDTLLQEYLRFQAVEMVAKRLERAEPPLRREVVEYMLDPGSEFSIPRSTTNYFRVISVLSGLLVALKWFHGVREWKNPLTTTLIHVVFLTVVCYTKLVLPLVFLYLGMIGLWNYRHRPRKPPYMDMRMWYEDPYELDELDEEFDTLQPPNIDSVRETVMWMWYEDLDEDLDTPSSTKPYDHFLRMRYDQLRSVAGRLQMVAGDLARQGERVRSLLSWRDPTATTIFTALSLVVAVVLYLTPFRVVATVIGLYILSPPWLRWAHTMFFGFYTHLPSEDDVIL